MHYTQTDLADTIVALSTPTGVGAIGVIRLSGLQAIAICNKVFKGKDLSQQASHTIHYGTIRTDEQQILDEVLVSLFIAPRSYTGDNMVEVSCHGSPYILQKVIELFIQKGARLAKPGEFTMRAFLNGKMDLSQAEAVADLIASESRASHQIAMQQMRGGFSNQIADLREQLVNFASLIELELDFGEEDVEFANRDDLKALVTKIQRLIEQLSNSFKMGNAIKNGINTVIAGRPNAGKSTLLNALLNEERAIVSEIAGTTRDTIEEVLNINGIPFRLIDTAGIREASDTIEAIGVERTMAKIKESAILIYVYDRMALNAPSVYEDLQELNKEGLKIIVVGNKSDLYDALPLQYQRYLEEGDRGRDERIYWFDFQDQFTFVYLSAKEDTDLDGLKKVLYEIVVDPNWKTESTIVTNVRHYEALEKANQALQQVLQGLEVGITGDFLAQDIRYALAFLGEITGEISSDDLLGNIFSNFCIGK